MRKVLIALACLAVLVSCGPGGLGGSKPLARMAAGTGSYFIQGQATAPHSLAGKATVTAGALYRVSGGTIGAVSFVDTQGISQSVEVDHALSLSSGGLVVGLSYDGESLSYIADATTGTLTTLLPAPDGWDYARESGGSLYYIGGGSLYRAPLSTGVGEKISDTDTCASGAWLYVDSTGGVVYVDANEQFMGNAGQRYYTAAGGAGFRTNLQIADPHTYDSIEGIDGVIYQITRTGADVHLWAFAPTGGGNWSAPSDSVLTTLSWVPTSAAFSVSSKKQTHEITIAYDYGFLRIVATASGLEYSVTEFLPEISAMGWTSALESYCEADSSGAYLALHENGLGDVTKYHIWGFPYGTMAAKGMGSVVSELTTDHNISSLIPVGSKLFYTRDNGAGVETVAYDTSTGTSEVYASGAVAIQPVY